MQRKAAKLDEVNFRNDGKSNSFSASAYSCREYLKYRIRALACGEKQETLDGTLLRLGGI
jgi:hypothetical protein